MSDTNIDAPSRDTCIPLAMHAPVHLGTRKDSGRSTPGRRVFAQIYNPSPERERAEEGVVWEWVMIHSPACEAFRDRRIRRDPETAAEPSPGSSQPGTEKRPNVAYLPSRSSYLESFSRVLSGADADAGRRVHFVVLVSRVVASLDYLWLFAGIRLLDTNGSCPFNKERSTDLSRIN